MKEINNQDKYFIYHIFGKKIGVTTDIKKRVETVQGYYPTEYEILESSNDIDYVSEKELALQKLYGYKIDRDSYRKLVRTNKQKEVEAMNLNVTDQTTTFPFPINKLKGHLMDNLGFIIKTPLGSHKIDQELVSWIMDNVKTSMYNPSRSYVYNKAMFEFSKSSLTPVTGNKWQVVSESYPNVYDLIREWADNRGIYKNGDLKTQYVKLQEESGELAKAILTSNKEEIIDAIGDMMVVLTNLAALEGLKVEDCVVSAYDVIKNRSGNMVNGTFIKDTL
jgi:NTP pyrophosphatase (non-canonical NTP hydrolase)